MQNFANAAFAPDVIAAMTSALEAAITTLPEPVHSFHVNVLAESILRTQVQANAMRERYRCWRS